MNLTDYDYFLPQKNLALEPVVPRDSSKLFIYDTTVDKITFDYFYNLDKYLPKNSFMVMNNTKVLPARVNMKKSTGGKVVLLFLVNELTSLRVIKALSDRKIAVGEKVYFDSENYLKVVGQKENIFKLEFNFSREHLFDLLKKYGAMPIPPYLKKSALTRDQLLKKYQTIIAKTDGSSAAPTASLHFTDRAFKKLDKKGIDKFFVTLHVGMGTFAPINEDNIKQKKLHNEFYEIDRNTWKQIEINRNKGKKLVAVGTTVVRTLESIAQQINQKVKDSDKSDVPEYQKVRISDDLINPTNRTSDFRLLSSDLSGSTDLFIFPPLRFQNG